MQYLNLIQLLVSAMIVSIVQTSETTLKQLHILWRHGDRTPISFYKTDPYSNPSYWPEGSGQLTKIGKSMEYSLGIWLRNRYSNFTGSQFHPKDINVFSTDFDRTLMSAQCVLAALFYPTNETKFRDGVNWIPTPIHTAPSGSDTLLNVDAACPRIAEEVKKVDALPEVFKYVRQHKEVMKYLTKYSGQVIDTLMAVDFIYDTLYIEKLRNLTLPSWTGKYFDTMKVMSTYSFFLSSYSTELKRLRGGPLLGSITSHMKNKLKNETEGKVYMYSAHDSTVSILLGTMGVFNNNSPPYAATLLWELHRNGSNNFVRLFYQNDSTMASPPHQLTIPGCSPDCPLNDWERLFKDVIPSDWHQECGRSNPVLDQYYIFALSGLCGALSGILIVIVIVKLYYIIREPRLVLLEPSTSYFANNNNEDYDELTEESFVKVRAYYGSVNDTFTWQSKC